MVEIKQKVNKLSLKYNTDLKNYIITKSLNEEVEIPIAIISKDIADYSPYIKTIGANLQDYIISYDDYKDFIRLVDASYFELEKVK